MFSTKPCTPPKFNIDHPKKKTIGFSKFGISFSQVFYHPFSGGSPAVKHQGGVTTQYEKPWGLE